MFLHLLTFNLPGCLWTGMKYAAVFPGLMSGSAATRELPQAPAFALCPVTDKDHPDEPEKYLTR